MALERLSAPSSLTASPRATLPRAVAPLHRQQATLPTCGASPSSGDVMAGPSSELDRHDGRFGARLPPLAWPAPPTAVVPPASRLPGAMDRCANARPVADRGLNPVEDATARERSPAWRRSPTRCSASAWRTGTSPLDREPQLLPSLDGKSERGRRRFGAPSAKSSTKPSLSATIASTRSPCALWHEPRGWSPRP